MTKEEVCQLFMAGIDCSQVVTGACAEKNGNDQRTGKENVSLFRRWNDVRGDLRRCDRRVNGPWNGIWAQ